MTTVRCLDPTADDVGPLLTALHPGLVSAWSSDQPYEPAPTLRAWHSQVRTPWSGAPARVLVAQEGRRALGIALLELPSYDNRHLGSVDLHVAPGDRRCGTGRALWTAACDVLRSEGRHTLLVEARAGSPMAALAAAMGAAPALADVQRHQPLRALDLDFVAALRRDAARHAAGYRLEAWRGPTPVRLRAALAAATQSLNDAPMDGLDLEDEIWDAARIAARDRALGTSGLRRYAVLALAPDGSAAGFTDVAVSEDGTYAWQWGTGVARAHRGHRLGMLLKATMVERLRRDEPALEVVSTWNAASNGHMVAVNEALGYRPVDEICEWQAAVG